MAKAVGVEGPLCEDWGGSHSLVSLTQMVPEWEAYMSVGMDGIALEMDCCHH